MSVARIYAIALNTYREAVRDRVLFGVLVFAAGVLALTLALAELSLDQQMRVVTDVGLASISLFSVVVAIFLGSSLLYKEIERKTLYVILPKPIARFEFLLGLNDYSYLERMGKSNLYCQEQALRLKERHVQIQWWHMLFLPLREFIKKYLARSGYRDGVPGLLFALHSTAAMFKACALVWDDQNSVSRQKIEKELNEKWSNYSD